MAKFIFAFEGWKAYSAEGGQSAWELYRRGAAAFTQEASMRSGHILRMLVGAGIVPGSTSAGGPVFAGECTGRPMESRAVYSPESVVVSYYSEVPEMQGVQQALRLMELMGLNVPNPAGGRDSIVVTGFSFGGDAAWELAKRVKSFGGEAALGFTMEPRPRGSRFFGNDETKASWYGDARPPAARWVNYHRTRWLFQGFELPGAENIPLTMFLHEGPTRDEECQRRFAEELGRVGKSAHE